MSLQNREKGSQYGASTTSLGTGAVKCPYYLKCCDVYMRRVQFFSLSVFCCDPSGFFSLPFLQESKVMKQLRREGRKVASPPKTVQGPACFKSLPRVNANAPENKYKVMK